MTRLRVTALSLVLALAGGRAVAQQSGIPRAFELERRGDYAGAAAAYRTLLSAHPADLAALLGLERALLPLNQQCRDSASGAGRARGRCHEPGHLRHRASGVGGRRRAG